ncbi:MAG: LCP family protein [Firmicutes bacterium]|nr:LCP family protein [Bacillota bacterium]
MRRRRVKKKAKFSAKKRAVIFGISLAVLVTAFIAVMGFGGFFSLDSGYNDPEEMVAKVDKETGKINILAIGLDNDGTRTDTIIVVSYDLDGNLVNILSIPRDTRMYVGGNYQKINCAYAVTKNGKRNGVNGTIEAVTRLTGIPIHYYVEFTFETFREVIDALGGVDFDIPQNMNYDDPVQNLHIHLKKGFQHLDGDKSEQLVRFRKYPMGDIDRVKVQQSFMKALAEQKLNSSIIGKLPDLFKVLQKDIKTNFKVSDITKYALNLMDLSSENVKAYSLPGTADSESYGASYWVADMAQTKVLIEETFGYDASKITIHSADGKSISKDVKRTVKKEPEETKKENTEKVPKTDSKTVKTDTEEKAENKEEPVKNTEKPQETENPKKEIKRPSANEAQEAQKEDKE